MRVESEEDEQEKRAVENGLSEAFPPHLIVVRSLPSVDRFLERPSLFVVFHGEQEFSEIVQIHLGQWLVQQCERLLVSSGLDLKRRHTLALTVL